MNMPDDQNRSAASEPPSSRVWLYVLSGFAAFWILYLTFFGPKGGHGGLSAPRLQPPETAGKADSNWRPLDLEGKPTDFASYRGRVVFLNIWATWCPPCVAELPSVANLASNPQLKDVAFVCVSIDEQTETVKRFLKDKSWPMTVLRADSLPKEFLTDGIPATFILDGSGNIVVAEVGSSQWDDPSTVDFLKKLAGNATKTPK